MLNVLDERWKDHLYDLDQLRNAIQYRAWGQKDPLVEYKREAFEMFEDLMHDIQSTFTERFLKIQVSAEPPPSRHARRRRAAAGAATDVGEARGRPHERRGRAVHGPGPAGAGRTSRAAWPGGRDQQLARPGRAGRRPRCPRWAGTIRVPAGRARSTRSATGWWGGRVGPAGPGR